MHALLCSIYQHYHCHSLFPVPIITAAAPNSMIKRDTR